MNELMQYLIIIGAIIAFPLFVSLTRTGFSVNTFLTGVIIAISVLIWKQLLPISTIIICIVIMVAMLFSDRYGGGSFE